MINMKKFTSAGYVTKLISVISSVDHEKINSIVAVLLNARKNNKTIFIAGNGGSAATASHMVTDFMFSSKITGPKMKVYCLNENTSVLTATGNDKGFDEVFSRQLENLASDGDVLILISASGNSINLLNCLSLCEKKNITTIGLTGFDGGSLKSKVNISLHVQTEMSAYGIVEDTHMVVGHIITELLKVQSAKEDLNG